MKLSSLEIKLLREYALAESQTAQRRYQNMKSQDFRIMNKAPVFSEFQMKRMYTTFEFYKTLAVKLGVMHVAALEEEKGRKADVALITNGRMQ